MKSGIGNLTLVMGGVRSGKSDFAQNMLLDCASVAMIATAEALDDEMRKRIARHKADRPANWTTIEEPLELAAAIDACNNKQAAILVDCLTLWASNLLYKLDGDLEKIHAKVEELCQALERSNAQVVLVSNEVGSGVVPLGLETRQYVDLLGAINRKVAAVADNLLLLVAGVPLKIK